MISHKRKYRTLIPIWQLLFIGCCFFSGIVANAQSGETVIDTVVLTPPADQEEIETIQEEMEEEEDEEEEVSYFSLVDTADFHSSVGEVRRVSAEEWKQTAASDDYWYANYAFKKKTAAIEEPPSPSRWDHPVFQTILWLLIIAGFISFVVLYLANSNVGIFRRSRNIQDDPEETNTDDIFAINYQQEIDKAVTAGNYRFAVRMMYLRLLKNLSERNIIQYKQDLTNFDYLQQLSRTKLYPNFFKLTRHYEYTWYGQFDLRSDGYQQIRREFESFDRELY